MQNANANGKCNRLSVKPFIATALLQLLLAKPLTITYFFSSNYEIFSGPHRYVFVLYDQGRKSVRSRVSRNRAGFDLEKWSTSRQDLGKPVAGNFYFAEN